MGTSKGAVNRLFAQVNTGRTNTATTGMAPVGSNRNVTPVDVTVVYRNAAGKWVYGEEVAADRATRSRPLPRGSEGTEDRFYMRAEYEFAVDKLKRAGGGRPAVLVYAEMPIGYSTVFLMPLQRYWAKESMAKLPDAYDAIDVEDYSSKFNPLRFTAENYAARKSDPDLKAIAEIAAAEHDIYLTKDTHYRASLAGALVSDAFHDANPNKVDSRWVRGHSKVVREEKDKKQAENKSKLPEDMQRLGLVMTDIGSIEDVVGEIIFSLEKTYRDGLVQTFENGYLNHANKRIKAAPNLDNLFDAAIELGAWQALAGVDEGRNVWEGEEVATLARRYADAHLAVWNNTRMKEAAVLNNLLPVDENGEFLHGVDRVEATQDNFEVDKMRKELESAPTEREYLLRSIELLETIELGLSPEEIASGIRLKQRQLRKLDDAAN